MESILSEAFVDSDAKKETSSTVIHTNCGHCQMEFLGGGKSNANSLLPFIDLKQIARYFSSKMGLFGISR